MQEMLGKVARQAGRESDFIQRQQLTVNGMFWLTRLPAKVRVWDAQGQKRTSREWLQAYAKDGRCDGEVVLTAKGWRARLLALRVQPHVAAQRQEWLVAEARRRGCTVSAESLALCRCVCH